MIEGLRSETATRQENPNGIDRTDLAGPAAETEANRLHPKAKRPGA
jgi:hypothetical protein